jgi:diaminopimelate epimerase
MRLTKHHGLGNDFLVVLDTDASHPVDADLARALCDRHTGVGADGIMRATPAPPGGDARVRMELRNADGSRAEMSGNGIRCLAQAVLLAWPGVGAEIPVATDAGLRTVTVHERVDAVTHSLSVAMGAAVVEGEAPEWTGGGVARALVVDTGNPHLVLDLSSAGPEAGAEVDLVALGETVNAKVPGGANVHLLTVARGADADAGNDAGTGGPGIAIRTYERGVGPTRACGTGACASAAAARAWGLVGERVPVDMPGGRAEVSLGAAPGDQVVLRGPATFVAEIHLGESPWR